MGYEFVCLNSHGRLGATTDEQRKQSSSEMMAVYGTKCGGRIPVTTDVANFYYCIALQQANDTDSIHNPTELTQLIQN